MNAATMMIIAGALLMMLPIAQRVTGAASEARQRLGGTFNAVYRPPVDMIVDHQLSIDKLDQVP